MSEKKRKWLHHQIDRGKPVREEVEVAEVSVEEAKKQLRERWNWHG